MWFDLAMAAIGGIWIAVAVIGLHAAVPGTFVFWVLISMLVMGGALFGVALEATERRWLDRRRE